MPFLTFFAETGLHVGVGQEMGPIDLPIQRERHTGLPLVAGHGVKGALRAHAATLGTREPDKDKQDAARRERDEMFGPEASQDLKQGRLIVRDALPLAVPFRCLTDVFVWVTCPLLLQRFNARTGAAITFSTPSTGHYAARSGQRAAGHAVADDSSPDLLVIEDLDFRRRQDGGHSLDLATVVAPALSDRVGMRRVVVVADGDFAFLVRHCLPVVARVQLTAAKTTSAWYNPDRDKEEKGNLWAEELLPPETVLYAPLDEIPRAGPASPVEYVKGLVAAPNSVIQLGGNETVGLGWCWVSFHEAAPSSPGEATRLPERPGKPAPAAAPARQPAAGRRP